MTFSKIYVKNLIVSKKMAKNVLKNPGRALENTTNIATAAPSRNLKAFLSTLPELITFYITGKSLYLGKFVRFNAI